MNAGMQIIDNHKGENNIIGSGMIMPWNYHSTGVTEETKNKYNQTVEEYQNRHPDPGQGTLKINN
ncbi:MAG: hypothetical protein ABJB11_11815 [Ferruginibacter sp.]